MDIRLKFMTNQLMINVEKSQQIHVFAFSLTRGNEIKLISSARCLCTCFRSMLSFPSILCCPEGYKCAHRSRMAHSNLTPPHAILILSLAPFSYICLFPDYQTNMPWHERQLLIILVHGNVCFAYSLSASTGFFRIIHAAESMFERKWMANAITTRPTAGRWQELNERGKRPDG